MVASFTRKCGTRVEIVDTVKHFRWLRKSVNYVGKKFYEVALRNGDQKFFCPLIYFQKMSEEQSQGDKQEGNQN
jgi:hypothetical protein